MTVDRQTIEKLTTLDQTDPLPKPRRQKRTTAVTRPTTPMKQNGAELPAELVTPSTMSPAFMPKAAPSVNEAGAVISAATFVEV